MNRGLVVNLSANKLLKNDATVRDRISAIDQD